MSGPRFCKPSRFYHDSYMRGYKALIARPDGSKSAKVDVQGGGEARAAEGVAGGDRAARAGKDLREERRGEPLEETRESEKEIGQ